MLGFTKGDWLAMGAAKAVYEEILQSIKYKLSPLPSKHDDKMQDLFKSLRRIEDFSEEKPFPALPILGVEHSVKN